MKVTFAHWGNYTSVFTSLFEHLGLEVVPPEKTNLKTIEEGCKLSPELFCFPLKVNIGNYLSALRKGADTIFMWENIGGSCRQRYYWAVQEKILQEAGFKVRVLNFNSKNLLSRIKEIKRANHLAFWQVIRALYFSFKKLGFIENLEKRVCFFRPREKIKGTSDKIFNEALTSLGKIKNLKELAKLKKRTWENLLKIKIDQNRQILRVGLVGEIYTVTEAAVNFDLEKKLGWERVEVHRHMFLSYHLKAGLFPWKEWFLQRKIMPYLKSTVGGHGRDAIKETLEYAEAGFDGVIQLLPFGCMPETTVRPILQKISQEAKIPFLSFSLDEQTAEAGIQTRLEAFIDLLRAHKNNLL